MKGKNDLQSLKEFIEVQDATGLFQEIVTIEEDHLGGFPDLEEFLLLPEEEEFPDLQDDTTDILFQEAEVIRELIATVPEEDLLLQGVGDPDLFLEEGPVPEEDLVLVENQILEEGLVPEEDQDLVENQTLDEGPVPEEDQAPVEGPTLGKYHLSAEDRIPAEDPGLPSGTKADATDHETIVDLVADPEDQA